MTLTHCANCRKPKAVDSYQACAVCRAKWREAKRYGPRKTVPMKEMQDALRVLAKVKALEYGPQSAPVSAVLSKYREYLR